MRVLDLVAAMALSGSSPAPATPGSVRAEAIELRWQAPATCPSTPRVEGWIAALTPESTVRARVTATVAVEAIERGYRARVTVETDGRRSDRTLEAEDCTLLARAVAVVVAVSLDPLAVTSSGERPVLPRPPAVERPAPMRSGTSRDLEPLRRPGPVEGQQRRARDADGRDSTRSRGGLHAGARVGAALGGGLLPGAGVGFVLAPFVGVDRFHVRLTAQYWARRRIDFDPRRDAAGELRLATGGLRLCPRLGRDSVSLSLCAGVDAGAVLGRGIGTELVEAREARAPWAGAILQPGVALSISSWMSLWLALEGVISLFRPVFTVDGAAARWIASPGGLRGLVGLQFHRPRKKP